jgi:uncharacterized protein YndB with AHSA1/START domain
MADALHMEVTIAAPPARVYAALTDSQALAAWFAEFAEVAVDEGRYDFWGRFTPETPDREGGRHALRAAEEGRRLAYDWRVQGTDTTVEFALVPRDGGTTLALTHRGVPKGHELGFYSLEDFWFLSLENLRRHLDGRPVTRCDFSAPGTGDIRHSVEIAGGREAVFAALIRPEELERWIASAATVEPVVGGRYDFGWGGAPMKILDLAPGERLAYTSPPEGDTPETVVTWTLEGAGGRTRLTIVHSGFAPDAPTEGLRNGWLNFLSWVRSAVEYGPGWTPPVLALHQDVRRYYAASIGRAQDRLILAAE